MAQQELSSIISNYYEIISIYECLQIRKVKSCDKCIRFRECIDLKIAKETLVDDDIEEAKNLVLKRSKERDRAVKIMLMLKRLK